jgi:hypothetical protein
MREITVEGLITLLQGLPPDLPVAVPQYSENRLLEANDLNVSDLCDPRPDGWLQNRRPDMPTRKYLVIG